MQPQLVDNLDFALGRIEGLMPAVPKDFKPQRWSEELFRRLFYDGGKFELLTKAGIHRTTALRHIMSVMRSFEPKHEIKEAACTYLFELWFQAPI